MQFLSRIFHFCIFIAFIATASINALAQSAPPVITSVDHASMPVGGRQCVNGTGFGSFEGNSTFTLNGTVLNTAISWSDSQFCFQVPYSTPAGTATVQLTTANGTSNGLDFTLTPPPVVNSISPERAAPGTQVTITGTYFGAAQGNSYLKLDSTIPAVNPVVSWSDTQVVFIVPEGTTPGSHGAYLYVDFVIAGADFTVPGPPPVLNSLDHPSMPVGGRQCVTGTNFGPWAGTITLNGGVANTSDVWSDSQFCLRVPYSTPPGPATVQLTTIDGTSNSLSFTLTPPPVINSITPERGTPGTQVTITGTNFGATQGNSYLQFDTTVPVVSWSDTQVVFTVPQGATLGSHSVWLYADFVIAGVDFTVTTISPLLQLSINDTPLQVNLSSPQVLDWIHWGRISPTEPDRKAGVTSQISDYSILNNAPVSANSGVVAFSWIDGDHSPLVSETLADVEVSNVNGGFQLTVPADTTVKTLNLYLEISGGTGALQASLSDGSVPSITDQSVTDLDFASKTYSIDFRAASSGQTLTVSFSAANGATVGLQAATLTSHLPVVAIASPAAGQQFSAPASVPVNINATQADTFIANISATGSEGTVLQSSASPLNASWGPLAAGHYSLAATATDTAGLSSVANPVEFDIIGQGGSLSIAEVVPASPIDLESQGSADWVLWGPLNTGDSIVDNPGHLLARKSGVAPLISEYKPIGNHPIAASAFAHNLCFASNQQDYCGSDIAVHDSGNGFEINVAADTTPRTLQLYVGTQSADGKIIAFLSDGSAPVTSEVGGGGGTPNPGNTTLYNIQFAAASPGRTLTVRFTMNSDQGGGQIALIGATLSGNPIAPSVPAPQISFLDPPVGQPDTIMTIHGSNFGATQGQGEVVFGGIEAAVTSWNDSQITVIVPAAFTPGANTVSESEKLSVSNSNGVSNELDFTISGYKVIPQNLKMLVGQSQILQAIDNRGNLITGLSWSAADPSIVNVGAGDTPSITALAAGTTTVYAGVVPVPVTIYLTPPSPMSIIVSPGASQLPLGLTQQFVATGVYADGSTQNLTANAVWSSSSPSVATVSAGGRVVSTQVGITTIQASLGSISGSTALTIQPAALKTIVLNPAIPGVVVGGTLQFNATGAYTDGSTQDITASVTWSSLAPSVASINDHGLATGTGSGRAIIVATLGSITRTVSVTVAATATPPGISTLLSPSPNAQGWVNRNTTISFVCTPGSAPVVSCPASQSISTEGSGQVVSGTVTDSEGNSASANVTVSLDKTKPALAVSSPADQAVVTSATLAVTGSASDALSGLAGVTCNGLPASISESSFSCDVSLNPGLNAVVLRATDVANNTALLVQHVTLAAPLPLPQSLQVTPGNAYLLIGDVQQFTVVDEAGRVRTDATWTVSDSSLATITMDSAPVLTGLTVGQVTLTANVGAVSGQSTVTILAGVSLPVGVARWSVSSSGGFTPFLVVQAEPATNGPDMFSVERSPSGDISVRGLTTDGRQVWLTQVPSLDPQQTVVGGAGDKNGGFLLVRKNTILGEQMMDLDAQTGSVLWTYNFAGLIPYDETRPAIATDGTIYFWEQSGGPLLSGGEFKAYLMALDGATGTEVTRYEVPTGINIVGDSSSPEVNTYMANPVIDADDTVWASYSTIDTVINDTQLSFTEKFSLLKVASGAQSSLVVATTSGNPLFGPYATSLEVIPNGQGGALVSWQSGTTSSNGPTTIVNHISNVYADGGTADFVFPLPAYRMVLGGDGAAFATSNTAVTAFNPDTGGTLWTYAEPADVVATTPEHGLIVNRSNVGLVTLDSAGAVLTSMGVPLLAPVPGTPEDWAGISNNAVSSLPVLSTSFAAAEFPFVFGNKQHQQHDQCPLTLNLAYGISPPPVTKRNVKQGLEFLFKPAEVRLIFADGLQQLNMNVASIVPNFQLESGVLGFVPNDPQGNPRNQGQVDYGKHLVLQHVHKATDAQLGRALALTIGHELGHELFLGHNKLNEGLMAAGIDPFIPNGFTFTDNININSRCKFLQKGGK